MRPRNRASPVLVAAMALALEPGTAAATMPQAVAIGGAGSFPSSAAVHSPSVAARCRVSVWRGRSLTPGDPGTGGVPQAPSAGARESARSIHAFSAPVALGWAALAGAPGDGGALGPEHEEPATGTPRTPTLEGPQRVPAGSAMQDNAFASAEPSAPAPARQHLRLVIAGDVVTGLGIGGFLLMAAGLVVRSNGRSNAAYAAQRGDDADYQAANARADLGATLAITGGVSALASITTGVALIVTGRRRERKRREAMQPAPPG